MSALHEMVDLRWFGPDVFELAVRRNGMAFVPGDCVALFGADRRVSRPYSISSGTGDEALRFLIRRMPGGEVSEFLAALRPGDAVPVSPPFGWFRPGEHAATRPFIFISTGTGVAPFLSHLRSRPDVLPAAFLHGVRRSADLAHADLLRQGGARIAVSREDAPGCVRGRVTALLDTLSAAAGADIYLCGLDTMIDDVTAWLEARGIPISRIHRECFFNAAYDG